MGLCLYVACRYAADDNGVVGKNDNKQTGCHGL